MDHACVARLSLSFSSLLKAPSVSHGRITYTSTHRCIIHHSRVVLAHLCLSSLHPKTCRGHSVRGTSLLHAHFLHATHMSNEYHGFG